MLNITPDDKQYFNVIENLLKDHKEEVHCNKLCSLFHIHFQYAQRLLQMYIQENYDSLAIKFLVTGLLSDLSRGYIITTSDRLEETKSKFKSIESIQLHSASITPSKIHEYTFWQKETKDVANLIETAVKEDQIWIPEYARLQPIPVTVRRLEYDTVTGDSNLSKKENLENGYIKSNRSNSTTTTPSPIFDSPSTNYTPEYNQNHNSINPSPTVITHTKTNPTLHLPTRISPSISSSSDLHTNNIKDSPPISSSSDLHTNNNKTIPPISSSNLHTNNNKTSPYISTNNVKIENKSIKKTTTPKITSFRKSKLDVCNPNKTTPTYKQSIVKNSEINNNSDNSINDKSSYEIYTTSTSDDYKSPQLINSEKSDKNNEAIDHITTHTESFQNSELFPTHTHTHTKFINESNDTSKTQKRGPFGGKQIQPTTKRKKMRTSVIAHTEPFKEDIQDEEQTEHEFIENTKITNSQLFDSDDDLNETKETRNEEVTSKLNKNEIQSDIDQTTIERQAVTVKKRVMKDISYEKSGYLVIEKAPAIEVTQVEATLVKPKSKPKITSPSKNKPTQSGILSFFKKK